MRLEEADLLSRWERFKDQKARERVISASLRLVPPIARAQARKFGHLSDLHAELVAEGNLALTEAFDAFPPRRNVRFERYARPCIRNAVVRRAASLLSVVDRPWGVRVKTDNWIDPTKPDPIPLGEDTGCRRIKSVNSESKSNFTRIRAFEEPPIRYDPIELPWILEARLTGWKLKDIAHELGV